MNKSRTLEVFEHGALRISTEQDGITEAEFDALVRFNDRHQSRYFEVGHRRITFKHYVGYIEVGDLAIQVLPKADRSNETPKKVWQVGLTEMLRIALGMRLEQPTSASQHLARFRLLDLIAHGFLAEIESLMHQGLAKGYRTTESNGPLFRGRLKMAEHLRDNVVRADRFHVQYQTYDHDIAVNQVIATALDTLTWCGLSPSIAARVDACFAEFPAVSVGGVSAATLDRLHLGRPTQRYAGALVYAQMILAQQGPQLQAGRERVFALLFDMNLLWESFVAALFRRAAVPGLTISTQERHAFWAPHKHGIRRVRPDIVVRDRDARPLLVIDTKWKVPSNGLPSDDDLKQMFVYNELLGAPRSMLLYPRTGKSATSAGTYATKVHGCVQHSVGILDRESWSTTGLKQQVREVLEQCTTSG